MTQHIVYGAVDALDLEEAGRLSAALARAGCGVKLGAAFFAAHGPDGVRRVCPAGTPLFLDLKFHDIPNTVEQAVRAACRAVAPRALTVHAAGGRAMLQAAATAAAESEARPTVLAVTVLTSLDGQDLADIGVRDAVAAQVRRLAELAVGAGCGGIVCAPTEVADLRAALGAGVRLVVPGIRPAGSAQGDQKRVMTPAQAIAAGADDLVVGRPITGAADPEAAARAVLAEVGGAGPA